MSTKKRKINVELELTGTYTDEDLLEFINYELGGGAMNYKNPFYDENGTAEIELLNVEIEN